VSTWYGPRDVTIQWCIIGPDARKAFVHAVRASGKESLITLRVAEIAKTSGDYRILRGGSFYYPGKSSSILARSTVPITATSMWAFGW